MRRFFLVLVVAFVFIYAVHSTSTFKSYFTPDLFYRNVCNATFDVTKKGENIVLPLPYNYSVPHALYIAVPENRALHSLLEKDGNINYEFLSDNKVLRKGSFSLTSRRNSVENTAYSAVIALRFDLPMKGEGQNLKLKLNVSEPIQKMEKYSNSIFCFVRPEEMYE